MRNSKAIFGGKVLALSFLGTVLFAHSPVSAIQSEPDRLLRLNGGFGNANYYFCFAQSREAAYGVQVFTEVVSTDARVTLHQMLSGVDAATNPLPGRPWRDVRCMEDIGGGYATFKTREDAESYRQEAMASSRKNRMTIVEIPWPGKLGDRDAVRSTPKKARRPAKTASVAGDAGRSTNSELPTLAPKYVEIAGPSGTIRLSPEVLARNEAAAEQYRRKMEEHTRAKAEHERQLTLHEISQANAANEQREYQRRLATNEAQVAAHSAAMARHSATTGAAANTAKGWIYCEARGEIGSKVRYYSRIAEVDYVPGEITIIDVMAKNRAAFKAYLAGTHKVFFATDSLLHCPYSTDDLAEAQGLEARDKRGDGNNGIEIIQTGWLPAS